MHRWGVEGLLDPGMPPTPESMPELRKRNARLHRWGVEGLQSPGSLIKKELWYVLL